ncbi:SDR family NAD(P)-dependent oxidoreductase [Pusillimonas sp. SM2304]|uniref:SDR family NAD(P)-dependent oxidoreductase n=1 Tax=Pusillimonas sp. SM2304 TaxID=3073241 RepID=UPI00287453DE|nr:SDR family NAD(P)-dependent oxidoreductase [Pusillimonas sp. SM2304]MDS1140412.1 SDR family NAD(P)-dependent oxidoreductase [Pusillimonas sp. SM2304]
MERQVVLITGGASGIGYAAASAWVRNGLRVVISDINVKAGEAAEHALRAESADVRFIPADVSSSSACAGLIAEVMSRHGRLDIAFNNAGIAGPAAKVADCPMDEWRRTIDINLFGIYYCLAAELKAFTAQGHGVAINMASVYGKRGVAGGSAYCASKHAVIGLTKSAALEYGKKGIRINALCPGFIETPLTRGIDSTVPTSTMDALVARSANRRYGSADEIAQAAVWLASDGAAYLNGTAIDVDGGFLAA